MTRSYLFLIVLIALLSSTNSQPTASDSCVIYNTNYSVCTQCLPGLYLQYFFCIPCNPLCSCSNNTNYCQACLNITYQSRHYLAYRQGDICILCNQTIPYCLECNNNLTCTKCMMGRYLINGACSNQTCTQNCQICLSSTQCRVCAPGYYPSNGTGLCSSVVCEQNCEICNNSITCQVCKVGYFVDQGNCMPCIASCAVCLNNATCQVCIPSYIPSNGTCQSTGISNCTQYTGGVDSPTCLVCEPGYYNAGGSCTQCSGCLLCTQSFLCQTGCLPGFNKFNFACLQFGLHTFISFVLTTFLLVFYL